jgi:predicted nucleotidyltransferase
MNPAVHLDHDALVEFCRKWQVRELSLFGSALRDDFGPESDVDFLVSFDPAAPWGLTDIVTMRVELSTITGPEVNLVEKEGLRNPYRKKEILSTHEVILAF